MEYGSDMDKAWDIWSNIVTDIMKKSNKSIPELQFTDVTYSSDFAKDNVLNKLFSSCFNQHHSKDSPAYSVYPWVTSHIKSKIN